MKKFFTKLWDHLFGLMYFLSIGFWTAVYILVVVNFFVFNTAPIIGETFKEQALISGASLPLYITAIKNTHVYLKLVIEIGKDFSQEAKESTT